MRSIGAGYFESGYVMEFARGVDFTYGRGYGLRVYLDDD